MNNNKSAFTIVELLVVIVVIGILATITLVSYSGLASNASKTTLISDLKNASTQLELDKMSNNSENYPSSKEAAAGGAGLKSSTGSNLTYTYDSDSNSYCLLATNSNNASYYINSITKIPTAGTCPDLLNSFAIVWGGEGSDIGNSVVQTSDGGYAVTGKTDSWSSYYEIFLAKYDSSGDLTWNKTWGGYGGDEMGNSLVQTSDGGYAVTGWIDSSGNGYDMFIRKYDSNGTYLWLKTWGGALYDDGSSIIQTSDGGYAVTGSTGLGYDNDIGLTDMFIAKYDNVGTLLWDKTWGSYGYDSGTSIIQTSDGGYVVIGSTESYGAGNYDTFIVKYDSSGNLIWNKTWGGALNDIGTSVVQSSDGGFVVAGRTNSYGAGSYDMFIVKYDSSGNLIWNKTWGGTGYDGGYSLAKTNDGGYAVTGATDSYGAGYEDVFVVKYNSAGILSWNNTWGGADWDGGISIAKTSDGGYVVTGTASNFSGATDMLLIKYNSRGEINDCLSPMCQIPDANESSPDVEDSSPDANESSPVATESSPDVEDSSPSAITTRILPITPVPTMTMTFSSQELYIAWPGDNQTVCKEWTVPSGNTIKGFLVSQETESEYDYFTVSSNDIEIYNDSGVRTNIYVDLTSSPGTTLSACLSADGSTQDGYGGEVTGVLYN